MPHWLAGMGEREHPQVLRHLDEWCEQFGIAQMIALPMRHKLAKAWHARLGAALQLGDSPCACARLDRRQPDDPAGIRTHRLDDVAGTLLGQPLIARAERKGDRHIHPIDLHRSDQLLGSCHLRLGVAVKLFEEGVAREELGALGDNLRREDVGVKIDDHLGTSMMIFGRLAALACAAFSTSPNPHHPTTLLAQQSSAPFDTAPGPFQPPAWSLLSGPSPRSLACAAAFPPGAN